MIVMGKNKPRSPAAVNSSIFIVKSLFLVLSITTKVISSYKPCTEPPVVTIMFKVGQTRCPHRCLDLDELFCEDDGVTPVRCNTTKDCPFGTCETTACTSISCNEDDSDTVPYEKFKICKGVPPSMDAYESSVDKSICCDTYQIAFIVGAAVIFIIIITIIIAVIRKRRGRRVYRRPGAGNTELAMVYSEREVDER